MYFFLDLNKKFTVNPIDFQTKAKYSPYIGMELQGDISMTIVNGKIGYNNGLFYKTKGLEIDYI